MKRKFTSTNNYEVLIKRLLLFIVLFSFSRISLLIFSSSIFSDINFLKSLELIFFGLRFDLATTFMLMGVYILFELFPGVGANKYYRHFTRLLFLIPAIIALSFNYGDAVYFPFTLKRTTSDIFNYFETNDGFIELIPQFIIDYWYSFITWLISIIILIVYTYKTKIVTHRTNNNIFSFFTSRSILFLISIGLSIIIMRGGLQLKPIGIIQAGKYTKAQNISLILNTPFTIIKTIDQKGVDKKNYFSKKEIEKIYSPIHNADTTAFNRKNIVVLILESFSREHSGYLNRNTPNYQGFTPFLDSLLQQGVYVEGFANGKRSIEGIPAVTASLPTFMNNSYITSIYAGNKLLGLPALLQAEGYSTSFYHGGTNGTMGFDAFADMAGFQNYYGKNEYNNDKDFDGRWGIFDEPFLQYFAQNLNQEKEPFFTTLFTLSSHHPYTIPQQHKGEFIDGNLKIQKAVMYSDYALRRFFATAETMDWYKNTLFVITADHTSEGYSTYYKNRHGQYRIPIIFFDPNGIEGNFSKKGQQIDIEPTILDIINYPKKYIAFGRSLLSTKNFFAIQHVGDSYQIEYKNFFLIQQDEKTKAVYNIQNDSLLKNNIIGKYPAKEQEASNMLKAFIQEYNNRMIENRLTIE